MNNGVNSPLRVAGQVHSRPSCGGSGSANVPNKAAPIKRAMLMTLNISIASGPEHNGLVSSVLQAGCGYEGPGTEEQTRKFTIYSISWYLAVEVCMPLT